MSFSPGCYNVRDFGAVGDGVTDDSAAFQAAMDAMGPVTSGQARHGTLYLPTGNYRLNSDLSIERALKLIGTAPGSEWGKSRLLFARYKGIRVYTSENSPRGGDGTYAAFEDIDILCGHRLGSGWEAPVHPAWKVSTSYEPPAKILPHISRADRPGSTWEYYYECIRPGTSGASEPDWTQVQAIDQSTIWQPHTPYYYSNVVRSSARFDVYFQPITPANSQGARRSGPGEPGDFAFAVPGGTVTETGPDGEIVWRCKSATEHLVGDGGTLAAPGPGPVWACRVAAGIYAQARVSVNRVFIQGALNAAVHVQADSNNVPASNANGFAVYELKANKCGCGIVTRGDNCNASTVIQADVSLFDASDKEVGIAERSFLGNRYLGCQVAACKGPAYLVPSRSNTGGFYGCYSEKGTGPIQIVSSGFGVFGGTYDSGFTADTDAWVLENRWAVPVFYVKNPRGVEVETYVGYNDDSNAVLGWRASDDREDAPGSTVGFWVIRWYSDDRVWSIERRDKSEQATYLTGAKHPRGPGLQGFPAVLLGGSDHPIKLMAGVAPPVIDNSVEPGDIVYNSNQSNPSAPGYIPYVGWICVGVGPAREWKPFGRIEL